ncbi:MAG: PQQ-binding-like beta-propeller repeat protein [Blastocatellia bacterium]
MKIVFLLILSLGLITPARAQNWPTFRGPQASGVATGKALPSTWNSHNSTNILWKTRIPGLAHSSPIIWGNRVFITTAVRNDSASAFRTDTDDNAPVKEDTRHSWRLYCLDKTSGRIIWQKVAHEGVPKVMRHLKATQANSTPATDGKNVVAIFASEGLFCFDFKGNLIWKQDLGILDPGLHDDATYQWGYSSSPVIYKNLVIVQCDGHAQSFIAAYDLKDGKRVWSVPRGEMPSWSTPTIYEGKARAELITNAPKFIRGYDPATGHELWRFSNEDLIVQVPTPFIANEMFYLTGGWPGGRAIKVIRPGAVGDISLKDEQSSSEQVVWRLPRGGPYVPTPIVYGDYLYACSDRGVLACYSAKTGQHIYQQRINDQSIGFSASPVAADGKLYFASEDGEVYVIKAGPRYELLAINPIGEAMMATPAISDGVIVIRGTSHIFGIGARAALKSRTSRQSGGR